MEHGLSVEQGKLMSNCGGSEAPVVPPELLSHIISHCGLSTLLQLRFVSRSTQSLVDSFIGLDESFQTPRIKLCCFNLEEFVEKAPRSLPLSNFHIRSLSPFYDSDWTPSLLYETPDFFRDTPQLRMFLEVFGPGIQKLRLSTMYCGTVDEELEFFRNLPDLRDLEIEMLRPLTRHADSEDLNGFEVKSQRVPFFGSNLKRLAVDFERDSGEYLTNWIRRCPLLEVIKLPESVSSDFGQLKEIGRAIYGGELRLDFKECHPYIFRLGAEGHLQHLRTLDLNGRKMRMEECSKEDLRFLKEMMANQRIRLENVCPFGVPLETLGDFNQRISSLDAWDGAFDLLKEGFLNLVELSFKLPGCWGGPRDVKWTEGVGVLRLPALKTIRGSWDASMSAENPKSLDFLQCVFRPEQPRSKVSELELNVQVVCNDEWDFIEQHLITTFHHLETTFQNLTTLSVTLKYLSDYELCDVIEGISRLSLLEELSVKTCNGVPRDAFFRSNSDEPPNFLRLKNLRKLRLASLNSPGETIDDWLLGLLSRMSLTHLHIDFKPAGGLNGVTSRGIKVLFKTKRPFGRSILWVGLKALEGSGTKKSLSRLEKICHRNRFAAGLTSTSFEQFKGSEKAFVGSRRSFREYGWLETVF